MADPAEGFVYLLHFQRPIGDLNNPRGRAQHYMGSTMNIEARLAMHRSGRGAKIMKAVQEKGITWALAKVWLGDRVLERYLKNRHDHISLCPICKMGGLK